MNKATCTESIAQTELAVKHYCGTYGWINRNTGESRPFYCGSACCGRPECRLAFYRERVALISDLINEWGLSRFLTLTVDRRMSKARAWDNIPHVWHKWRTVISRKYAGLMYVAVLEAHEDGYPHIHAFINKYIPQRAIARHMANCGGGKIAWVESIKAKQGEMAEYVSKQLGHYVGKDQVTTAIQILPMGARALWRSQGMKTAKERKSDAQQATTGWELVKERIWNESENGLDKRHVVVYSESEGRYMVRPQTRALQEACQVN